MNLIKKVSAILISISVCGLCSCNNPVSVERNRQLNQKQNSSFSYGTVKRLVTKGKTSQVEIMKNFGAPAVTSIDADGDEVWMYEQTSTEHASYSASHSSWFGSDAERASNTSTRTSSLLVIFSFDKNGIVKDYSARSTLF